MKDRKKGRTAPARDQILSVARELFATNGFRDTTVREIARGANANGAAVNYYFRSKEALYEAIFDQAFQKFGRPLEDLVGTVRDQATWKAALEKWFDFMLGLFLLDTPEQALIRRLVAQERSSPTEFCDRIYDGVFLPVVRVFRALLRMALPDEPPESFQAQFATLLGMCTCFIHRDPPWDEIIICPSVPREDWVRMLRDEIVATILARHAFRTNRVEPDA
jgi:AcrR family transcriptional regulator